MIRPDTSNASCTRSRARITPVKVDPARDSVVDTGTHVTATGSTDGVSIVGGPDHAIEDTTVASPAT